MADMVRFSIRISSDMNDWLNAQSERTGIPKSTLVYLALDHYRKQEEGLTKLPELLEMFEFMKQQQGES